MRTLYALSALLLGATGTMASAADGPELHGFGEVSVKNDYVTPRGLVVTTAGATVQVLNGLVLALPSGIAFHVGTWTDINPGYSRADSNITAVNEFDFFFGVTGNITPNLKAGVEYVQFISGQPSVAFQDERNIEFSLKYSDAPDAAFSFNPYAKLFWAFSSKSSTVVLGKTGKTFDIELGAVPTYKTGAVTLSAPTWFTVGPKSYWLTKANATAFGADRKNFGVISTGLKVSTPLSFIKGGAGASIFAQAQYFHLVNDGLQASKALLNSGDSKRDHVVFGGGIGFNF
jgi:hypothetical protein